MDWYPLLNSLRIAAISTIVVYLLGVWLANVVAHSPRIVKGVLDVVLTLPLVLPPTVVGYLLLRVLGPKRIIGLWFLQTFGIKLTMTWYSAIFATVVVSFPLMGKVNLYVWEMEPGMVHENDAARRLAALCFGENCVASGDPVEGKIGIRATREGVFLVDAGRLLAVNCADDVMVATRKGGFGVEAGDMER